MKKSPGLSVCMIVKNESANIGDALACFKPFADEIIVVDTGSSDDTKEIAARFTSRIYDFEWIDDFSAARNFAKSKATKSYHLWVDADDRFDVENQHRIEALKSDFDGATAFYFILVNSQESQAPTSCRQLRCFPNEDFIWFDRPIHEQAYESVTKAGLPLAFPDIVITHLGYMTHEIRMAKAMRNLALMEKMRAQGSEDGGMYFFLALTYAPLGRRPEAMECMAEALERFERESYNHHLIPEAHLFQAKVAFEMGDHDKCIRHLAVMGCLAGENPLYNYHMGILYQRMGNHRQAVEVLKKVCGKGYVPNLFPTQPLPQDSELFLHIAYSLYCMNEQKGALELINSSTVGRGRSWEWLATKAYSYQNLGLAHIAFEAALRFGEIEPQSWARLGAVYKMRGYSEKARECFTRAGMPADSKAWQPPG